MQHYHYKDCGLPNIYLKNGFLIEQHEEYGETVSIGNLDGLHKAIGLDIVNNSVPSMSGVEFRFLRIELDLSQKALGDLLGTSEQTIANYEKNEPQPMGDKFIRILYKESVCENTEIMESLRRLNELDRELMKFDKLIEFEEVNDDWAITIAA